MDVIAVWISGFIAGAIVWATVGEWAVRSGAHHLARRR
jgi:hypothetical protein